MSAGSSLGVLSPGTIPNHSLSRGLQVCNNIWSIRAVARATLDHTFDVPL